MAEIYKGRGKMCGRVHCQFIPMCPKKITNAYFSLYNNHDQTVTSCDYKQDVVTVSWGLKQAPFANAGYRFN